MIRLLDKESLIIMTRTLRVKHLTRPPVFMDNSIREFDNGSYIYKGKEIDIFC